MDKEYPVFSGSRQVGWAKISRCGLYYRIRCKCKLSGAVLHRIVVSCGEKEESLGICMPMEGCFGLEKQIPVKRLGEGELSFRVVQRREEKAGLFVPIHDKEQFPYLAKLNRAYLSERDGIQGILIPE